MRPAPVAAPDSACPVCGLVVFLADVAMHPCCAVARDLGRHTCVGCEDFKRRLRNEVAVVDRGDELPRRGWAYCRNTTHDGCCCPHRFWAAGDCPKCLSSGTVRPFPRPAPS